MEFDIILEVQLSSKEIPHSKELLTIFSCISEGVQIIICTVVSAGIGAILFPIEQSEEEAE